MTISKERAAGTPEILTLLREPLRNEASRFEQAGRVDVDDLALAGRRYKGLNGIVEESRFSSRVKQWDGVVGLDARWLRTEVFRDRWKKRRKNIKKDGKE